MNVLAIVGKIKLKSPHLLVRLHHALKVSMEKNVSFPKGKLRLYY